MNISDLANRTEHFLNTFTKYKEADVCYNTIDRYFLTLEDFFEFVTADRNNISNIGKYLT